MPPRIFRPFAVPTNAMLYLAQCGHLWPVVALGHLFCNHFSKWFKKSGSRKVVDQKKNLSLQNHFSKTTFIDFSRKMVAD